MLYYNKYGILSWVKLQVFQRRNKLMHLTQNIVGGVDVDNALESSDIFCCIKL